MKHNTTIIEVLIGAVLVFTLLLAIRSFLTAKEPVSEAGLANLGDLEGTLKKILEQASQVPAAGVVAAAGGSEDTQKLATEINQLKADLEARQKTIEELKAAGGTAAVAADGAPAAAGGISDEEKAKMEAQLKELQGKLAEYEIISEDIADLSFYKEQNAKLTKELEALKGGAAPAAGATAAAQAPPPPPAAAATAAPSAPPPATPPPAPKEEPAIVGKSKANEAAPATPPPAPAAPEAPPQAAATPDPAVNVVDNDLMAEFNAAVEKQQGDAPVEPAAPPAPAEEAAATVDLGAMDVDKMMAEAAAIKSDGPDVSAEQALGVTLDENKLLQEATALQGVTPEDKKLMGQFENFVKKNE